MNTLKAIVIQIHLIEFLSLRRKFLYFRSYRLTRLHLLRPVLPENGWKMLKTDFLYPFYTSSFLNNLKIWKTNHHLQHLAIFSYLPWTQIVSPIRRMSKKFNQPYFSLRESVHIQSFSGPYFPAFGLNTGKHGVSLRIQS